MFTGYCPYFLFHSVYIPDPELVLCIHTRSGACTLYTYQIWSLYSVYIPDPRLVLWVYTRSGACTLYIYQIRSLYSVYIPDPELVLCIFTRSGACTTYYYLHKMNCSQVSTFFSFWGGRVKVWNISGKGLHN